MKLSFKIALIILLVIATNILAVFFWVTPLISGIKNILIIILILVLSVIPSSLFIWFLIHKLLLKPIVRLNRLAKIISSGNLGERVNVKAFDELGELAQNFNKVIINLTSGMQHMANSLRDEKRKEKELAKNYIELGIEKAKDEALLTSIGDGVIAIDQTTNIILFNDAASQMVGIDRNQIIGKPYNFYLKFLNEKDMSPATDFINLALHGEKIDVAKRIILQKSNGKVLPILQTISPILNSQKDIAGVVLVLKDITWERELEKLKDEFVSLASHELRTPMTAIKGLISMILEGDYGEINENLKDPLFDISKSTERLIQLVNDMLDVSRIEGGRIRMSITTISIPEIVDDVVSMLKLIADQKHIILEIRKSDIKLVNADTDKVKQILINLVNNAIKFTDHGTVTISYRSWGRYAYISVIDSGIGISKENQLKLFGKFAQISNSQQGRPPGTGLGLYISREFARIMGGEMWIERSEEGKGSTFTFALPFTVDVI